MRQCLLALTLSAGSIAVVAEPARAQATPAGAEVCLAMDETRDMLTPEDRTGALLVLARQFELTGRRVVASGCAIRYTLAHIKLGEHVFVILSGGDQTREATARGLSDLPALYNQMVRSLVGGLPMAGFNVIDRTNVTAAQTSANRVHSDRVGYARLGYGGLFGDRAYGTPGFGFGYRYEHDAIALDVSFLNLQLGSSESSGDASAGALLKLQALRLLKPTANSSPYVGAGLSWGFMTFDRDESDDGSGEYRSSFHGSGLQGELTAGYEMSRASTRRVFVEANVVLPFYKVAAETYFYSTSGGTATVNRRYSPSVVVSVGVGWQRNRD